MTNQNSIEELVSYLTNAISSRQVWTSCHRQDPSFTRDQAKDYTHTYLVYSTEVRAAISEVRGIMPDNLRDFPFEFAKQMGTLAASSEIILQANSYFTNQSISVLHYDLMFDRVLFTTCAEPVEPIVFKLTTGLNIVHIPEVKLDDLV